MTKGVPKMKARIVDVADLKKTQAEREAELLIQEMFQNKDGKKAIEVVLEQSETPRKVNRIFRKAAANLGKEIRIRTKDGRIQVMVK